MKITKSTLRTIIKEEIRAMQEVTDDDVADALLDQETPKELKIRGHVAAKDEVKLGKLPEYHEQLYADSRDYKKGYDNAIAVLRNARLSGLETDSP